MDNTMISHGNLFVQIDFKHCFDHHTRGIDAPCTGINLFSKRIHFLAIPLRLKLALLHKQQWEPFLDACAQAFCVLRRSNGMIISLCREMFAGICDASELETSLINKFQLDVLESKAKATIPSSKNATHNLLKLYSNRV